MEHKICKIYPNSIAEELEIEPGDVLVSVNGLEIEDVFDFRAMTQDEEFTILIRKANGEDWELDIEKDEDEELGLVFENDLMSDYKGCSNQCIFCFIDQMPPNMRETLYFKDDDSRLSFLQGNYITLTNMSDHDVERMIHYHMEPMNVSVHTTNPELRCKMLHNRFAGEKLKYLDRFYEAGLHMNGQIVLCKGWNDGEELKKTISDLMKYAPVMESVSVVPVGLTKYRDKLTRLEPFTKEDAQCVIDLVETCQKAAFEAFGSHFVHASDEFYILAERDFPEEERYDGYLQLENGVGMARSLYTDADLILKDLSENGLYWDADEEVPRVTFATGVLATPILENVKAKVDETFPGHYNEIIEVQNDFFGHEVTVAGLLTGQDLLAQLRGRVHGDILCLPSVMFRSGEEVFLDDLTRTDLEQALGVKTVILRTDAEALVHAMLGRITEEETDTTHGAYELTNLT